VTSTRNQYLGRATRSERRRSSPAWPDDRNGATSREGCDIRKRFPIATTALAASSLIFAGHGSTGTGGNGGTSSAKAKIGVSLPDSKS